MTECFFSTVIAKHSLLIFCAAASIALFGPGVARADDISRHLHECSGRICPGAEMKEGLIEATPNAAIAMCVTPDGSCTLGRSEAYKGECWCNIAGIKSAKGTVVGGSNR